MLIHLRATGAFVEAVKSNCTLSYSSSSVARNSRESEGKLWLCSCEASGCYLPFWAFGTREVNKVEQVQWRDTKIAWGPKHTILSVPEEAGRV